MILNGLQKASASPTLAPSTGLTVATGVAPGVAITGASSSSNKRESIQSYPNSQLAIHKRQEVQELRQRIQNILSTNDTGGQPQRLTPQPTLNYRVTGTAAASGNNEVVRSVEGLDRGLRAIPPNQQIQTTAGTGQAASPQPVMTIKPSQIQVPHQVSNAAVISNQEDDYRQGKRTTNHGNPQSFQATNTIVQSQYIPIDPQQSLQRLVSEDREPTGNNGQLSNRFKYGFQEHLNRRGSNMQPGVGGGTLNHQGAHLGSKGATSYSNSNLNKAAIVTMSSNQVTVEYSKITSQLIQRHGNNWLMIPSTVIKNKRVQEIIQSRQKQCQLCLLRSWQYPQQKQLQPSFMAKNSSDWQFQHDHLKNLVRESLDKKYLTSQDYYNSKIVSDIMYNENRHIVSVFKDYLIFDDFSEYLKRTYQAYEAYDRLPKVFEFYEKYSKVFPNYVALPAESKYMFKNIERKQKLIDEKHQQILERQEKIKAEQEEAKALGVAFDSSLVQRMRHSKNQIFGSQFINNLTEINSQINQTGGAKREGEIKNENSLQVLRQQSNRILDMLNSIQSNAPAYQHTSVMNQILRQHQPNNALLRQSQSQRQITNQTNNDRQEGGGGHVNIEHLIYQLTQIDNTKENETSIHYLGLQTSVLDGQQIVPAMAGYGEQINNGGGHGQFGTAPNDLFPADISMSSHGMSSFLQDFDLREPNEDTQDNHHPPKTIQRTVQPHSNKIQDPLDNEDESEFCFIETPLKIRNNGNPGSRESNHQQDSKLTAKLLQQTGRTASRQSLQAVPQSRGSGVERITPTGMSSKGSSLQAGKNSSRVKNPINKKSTGNQDRNVIIQLGGVGGGIVAQSSKNQQWSNILMTANTKKSQQDSVKKVYPGQAQQYKYPMQSQQIAKTKMKQPTPKNRKNPVLGIPNSITPQNQGHPVVVQSIGGSTSPQAVIQNPLIVVSSTGPTGQRYSNGSGGIRQSMHSADLQQQNLIQIQHYQTIQPSMMQHAINQQLSQSSLKSNNNEMGGFILVSGQPSQSTGGRTSQVSLGSPMSQHSASNSQPQLIKAKQQLAMQSQMIQNMPQGASLKQMSTAMAKVTLGQQRSSISGSGTDSSSAKKSTTGVSNRGSHLVQVGTKGSKMIVESFSNPSSHAGLPHTTSGATLGSIGNFQSSMRASPDFSMQPNTFMTSSMTGGNIKKVNTDISKSFKVTASQQQAAFNKLNPTAISQSIRDAVSKLLPPQQPKNQTQSVAQHVQQVLLGNNSCGGKGGGNLKTQDISGTVSATAPPQSLIMTNTAALFSKLFTSNNNAGMTKQQYRTQQDAQQQPVYSTRVPQKKNFSSPDDLQQRIAARKTQHQQLAIATAQNALQPMRKSANDLYSNQNITNTSSGYTASPQQKKIGAQKHLIKTQELGQQLSQLSKVQRQDTSSPTLQYQNLAQSEEFVKNDVGGFFNPHALFAGRSLGDDVGEEEFEDDQDEFDERNDVYTAKGSVTVNTKIPTISPSNLRARGEKLSVLTDAHQMMVGSMIRPSAASATATSSAHTYNFKVSPGGNTSAGQKRNPSNNSDKSNSSSLKSNYSTGAGASNPYQRVLSSFNATAAKNKIKGSGGNIDSHHQPAPNSSSGAAVTSMGSKLYEKIKSGMQAALSGGSTSSHQNHPSSSIPSQKTGAAAGKKKPSTIFTFNK